MTPLEIVITGLISIALWKLVCAVEELATQVDLMREQIERIDASLFKEDE